MTSFTPCSGCPNTMECYTLNRCVRNETITVPWGESTTFVQCAGCDSPWCVTNNKCLKISEQIDVLSPSLAWTIVKDEAQAVIESRESTHGNYTHQAMLAQELKKLIRGRTMGWNALSPEQRESVDMICVKISRIMTGNPNESDHWTDIAGYATLISNLLTKGTHL